jgi:diguanylate cyclase (GGDEF)-like protein
VTKDRVFHAPASPPYALIAISNLIRAGTFRQGVSDTLGLETALVRDGDQALQEIARRGPPVILIIDLSLPKVDGFTVVRKVRRQAGDTETRIIAIATHEGLRAAARELAAPLAISGILPMDVDHASLTEVLVAELQAMKGTQHVETLAFHAAQTPDVSDVIDRAAIEARRRFRMPISIGYLKVGEEEDLTFHVASRDTGPALAIGEVTEFRFLRQVAEASDPLVVSDVESHPVFAQLLLKGPRPVRGFAAVPIATSRADILAALCVLDTKPITMTASDIDAFANYGREVGREIDRVLTAAENPTPFTPPGTPKSLEINADEMKALQHLAATDPLTGLANRRGGEKNILNEISRAKRERRPLSCILLDIDRFKQVNDTFGHQAGDQLLRDISNLLRRTVRAYDILVRWGGEEFLLVLPGVDHDVARVLAERVRIAIEALDTHGIGPVTISAGVAKFENDYDFAATLKAADRRLYQAKASGRNCVV